MICVRVERHSLEPVDNDNSHFNETIKSFQWTKMERCDGITTDISATVTTTTHDQRPVAYYVHANIFGSGV